MNRKNKRNLSLNGFKFHPTSYTDTNSNHKLAKKNGKAIPLQAWTGPEGSRRLRLPDLKKIGT
jgi:hypothetical protein